MHAKVVLTAEHGMERGTTFVFDAPTCCVLGRAADCDLHMPNDLAHGAVSRHHCVLAVDPPHIWVRDLGSLNGTYVNAVNIGHHGPRAAERPLRPRALEEGDAIQTGNVLLTVHVFQEEERPAPPLPADRGDCCTVRPRVKAHHGPV